MNTVIQLIVGGVIGWLASIVMGTNAQMGLIANVVVGIIGSFIGGQVAAALGIPAGQIMSWVIAVAGAAVLIFLLKVLGIFK